MASGGRTLEALVSSLVSADANTEIKQKFKKLVKQANEPNNEDLHQHEKDELHRELSYKQTSRMMSGYQGYVSDQRKKDTVSFPLNFSPRQTPNISQISNSRIPKELETNLEKQLAQILPKKEVTDKNLKQLTQNPKKIQFSVDDIKDRQAHIAKLRAVLSYQEVKNRRHNKIKSKKEEKQIYDRAKERATLRHKNTSKWVQRQLRLGFNDNGTKFSGNSSNSKGRNNPSSRIEIIEQLRRGEELKRRRKTHISADEVEEFKSEKRRLALEDAPKKDTLILPGWGFWIGEGCKAPRKIPKSAIVKKKDIRSKSAGGNSSNSSDSVSIDPSNRKDFKMPRVIVSEKRDKKFIDNYTVPKVPFGYETKEIYDYMMRRPTGPEWNTGKTHNTCIEPHVVVHRGAIVDPLKWNKQVESLGPKRQETMAREAAEKKETKKAKIKRDAEQQRRFEKSQKKKKK
ncbi:MAG: putative U3 snoRNP protein Utp14 [Streblomastix strix]|uniref:Putative U3 snoRNP protein Utp14 n=1 Tax=Streblomastix strix TaxID=222440 RepID=A0A5J4W2M6_9EUKA|nr:MAG: putative U3 snoRNP protein Utp14 [Streblomastix strix]